MKTKRMTIELTNCREIERNGVLRVTGTRVDNGTLKLSGEVLEVRSLLGQRLYITRECDYLDVAKRKAAAVLAA